MAAVVFIWLLLGAACGGNSTEVLGRSSGRNEPTPAETRTERAGLDVGTVASLFDLTTVGSSDGLTQDQTTAPFVFFVELCPLQLDLSFANKMTTRLTREFVVCVPPSEALELVVTAPNGAEVFRESVERRGDQAAGIGTRGISSELSFDAPFGRYDLTATAADGSTRVLSFELGAIESRQLLSIRIDGQPYVVLAGFDPGVVDLSVFQTTGNNTPESREIEVFGVFAVEVQSNVSLLPITDPDRPLCVTPTQDLEKRAIELETCFG